MRGFEDLARSLPGSRSKVATAKANATTPVASRQATAPIANRTRPRSRHAKRTATEAKPAISPRNGPRAAVRVTTHAPSSAESPQNSLASHSVPRPPRAADAADPVPSAASPSERDAVLAISDSTKKPAATMVLTST